ncbi:hypothetical protein [Phyllobacterium myrsinacearum]|uniref:Uncharacterized protein n=1 Tax=Phyllobacterium myrsinacearum TaxID=28101 RepID=A0A839EWG0_9HYPH|nr:hypothetical protein [Phyllobacterium myrsinacearum]MBA8881646.1 hypothetical protein [Phyllobacterium myrsinacearum]
MNLSNIELGTKLAGELTVLRRRARNIRDGGMSISVGREGWTPSETVRERTAQLMLEELAGQERKILEELSHIGIYDDGKSRPAAVGESKSADECGFTHIGDVIIPGFGSVPGFAFRS